MAHKCTNCRMVYPDGSEDILDGCECGSRKFEYVKSSSLNADSIEEYNEKHAGTTDDSVKDPHDTLDDSLIIADETPEDESQHKARSEPITKDDLPNTPNSPTSLGDRETDIDEVKQQLHNQFEGIRILEPGNYQINIMKLYEKKECVISLQEDGRYVINMPGMMKSDDSEDKN